MRQLAPDYSTNTNLDGGKLLAGGVALLFVCVAVVQGYFKLLWGAEFVTLWIGQQRSFTGIWRAVAAGADPNPPLTHVLDWWSTAALGTSALAVRLPSILAMGLGLACLWVLLRRRTAPVYAVAGCLALMTTRGFDYAYDAQSYALQMAFAMAAVLLWSRSVEARGWRRVLFLIGLSGALAAGVSSNYFGILAVFPVAAGEICYGLMAKKWRIGAFVSMIAALLPLLVYLRLIRLHVAEFAAHARTKPQLSMISDSYLPIVGGIVWPMLLFAAFAVWQERPGRIHKPRSGFPPWERAAMWVLIAYPVIALLIALGAAGIVHPAAAAPVCFGVAIFGTVLLARYASGPTAAKVVVILCVWVLGREAACAYILVYQRRAFFHLRDMVERTAAPGETVVVGDSLAVMPLYWYGSAELRRAIVFPVDMDATDRSDREDLGARDLWGGRNGVFPVGIGPPAAVLHDDEEQVVVARPHGWLAQTMRERGDDLQQVTDTVRWDRLGGVSTPLADGQTRVLLATPKRMRLEP